MKHAKVVVVLVSVGMLGCVSGCASMKSKATAHVVAVRNPNDALAVDEVSLRAWAQVARGLVIQDHLVEKFDGEGKGVERKVSRCLSRGLHDKLVVLQMRSTGELDIPVSKGEKNALANLAVAASEHNRVWAEQYAGSVDWEAFLAKASVMKPEEWQREALSELFPLDTKQIDVVKEAVIRCQMLYTILEIQSNGISDSERRRYVYYQKESSYARLYLVWEDYQRALQGQPLVDDVLRADYAMGQWSKADLTFRMAESFPRVRAGILTLSKEDAVKLKGENRFDAAAFATFRQWMAGAEAPKAGEVWLSWRTEAQIQVWHLFREIPTGVFKGSETNVEVVKPDRKDYQMVAREAEMLPLPVTPPRRMEVGDRVKFVAAQ